MIDLAEGGQGLNFVGKELHHAGFTKADGADGGGETAEVGVDGLVVIQRQCKEAEYRNDHLSDWHIPGAVAEGERLIREVKCLLHPALVGADQGEGIERGWPHALLVAFLGHPATLQRVFLSDIPVSSPAL